MPTTDPPAPVGILLVDKPTGITSHTAVGQVRHALGTRRVGHAGTLDPDASGLLVVGVGAGTRLLHFLVGLDKTYSATIRLGITTETDDAAGRIVAAVGCPPELDVTPALDQFRGPQRQRPSAVSAVKIDGRRAYQRVRSGEDVELPERHVTVHERRLGAVRPAMAGGVPVLDVDVDLQVSSGTYIRALARDLGAALGVGGHLTRLRRTSVGPFAVDRAVAPDHVSKADLLALGEVAVAVLPSVPIDAAHVRRVINGVRLATPARVADGPIALTDPEGRLLAVAAAVDGRWEYAFVVPT